jgi:hypothetical protein
MAKAKIKDLGKTPQALDLSSKLAQMIGSPTSTVNTAKSKMPIIDNDKLYVEVDNYIKKNEEFKDAKVELELAEISILETGKEWYSDIRGEMKSVKLRGTKKSIVVTFKDAFSKIPSEVAENLKTILGSKFSDFFKTKRTITIKETAPEKDILELINTIGEEKFLSIFNIELTTVPVDNLDKKQFELPVAAKDLINQYKPALRVS